MNRPIPSLLALLLASLFVGLAIVNLCTDVLLTTDWTDWADYFHGLYAFFPGIPSVVSVLSFILGLYLSIVYWHDKLAGRGRVLMGIAIAASTLLVYVVGTALGMNVSTNLMQGLDDETSLWAAGVASVILCTLLFAMARLGQKREAS